MIRGYRGDVLEHVRAHARPAARSFVDNHEWQTNNVLLSLGVRARATSTSRRT